MQQDTTIGLDSKLMETLRSNVRIWFDAKVGRIGVCAHNAKTCQVGRCGSDLERGKATTGSYDEAAITRREGPAIRFLERRITGRFETRTCLYDSVIRRWGVINEVEKVGDSVLHGAGA